MLYGKFTSAVERREYYPAVVQSGNRYAYAGGNPVRYYDPSGLVVTAWDREHLTTYEQGLLSAYTNDWNNAYASGDEAGMNQASLAAESLRAKYRTNNEITLDNGVTISFENQNRSNEPINKPMEFFEQSRQEIELASGLKITGTPNSRAVLKNPDGSIKQIRYYDSDGNAKIDIDFNREITFFLTSTHGKMESDQKTMSR